MPADLKSSNSFELLLLLFRRRRRYRVTGLSMVPTLNPGDEVLIDPRAYRQQPPLLQDIVVARHPFEKNLLVIKRVAALLENGSCRLEGDNPSERSDSRTYGPFMVSNIIGRVTSLFG